MGWIGLTLVGVVLLVLVVAWGKREDRRHAAYVRNMRAADRRYLTTMTPEQRRRVRYDEDGLIEDDGSVSGR